MNPWALITFDKDTGQSIVRYSDSTDKGGFESMFCHLLAELPGDELGDHFETISYVTYMKPRA